MRILFLFLFTLISCSSDTKTLITDDEVRATFAKNQSDFELISTWFKENKQVQFIDESGHISDKFRHLIPDSIYFKNKKLVLTMIQKDKIVAVYTKEYDRSYKKPDGLRFYLDGTLHSRVELINLNSFENIKNVQNYGLPESNNTADCTNSTIGKSWVIHRCKFFFGR